MTEQPRPHRPRVGRRLEPLVDETPLDGDGVDVAVRASWLLRVSRLTAPGAAVGRKHLVSAIEALGVSVGPSAVSRIESGRGRFGALVPAYEHVLGLPDGSLRGPIDALYRAYPDASHATAAVVGSSDRDLDPLFAGTSDGGQWLRGVDVMRAVRLYDRDVERLTRRLVSELGRSVGTAYATRHEALALLRCSRHHAAVLRSGREVVAVPHAPVLRTLVTALSQRCDADTWRWAVSLLGDPRPHVSRAAVPALDAMAGSPAFEQRWWDDVLAAAVRWHSPDADAERQWVWQQVFVLLPAEVFTRLRGALPDVSRPSPPPVATLSPDDGLGGPFVAAAKAVTGRVGIEEWPVLARLLWDVVVGQSETRATTSLFLLRATPFHALVAQAITQIAQQHPGRAVQARAATRLMGGQLGAFPAAARHWLASEDPALRLVAAVLAGQSGRSVGVEALAAYLASGGQPARRALYALGMAQEPGLARVAEDPAYDPDVRAGARWWLEHGGLVRH